MKVASTTRSYAGGHFHPALDLRGLLRSGDGWLVVSAAAATMRYGASGGSRKKVLK
jgi:hypothetical protein